MSVDPYYECHTQTIPKVLQRKGRGGIIHVSGFINAEDGQLALCDELGNTVEEARVIPLLEEQRVLGGPYIV